MDGGSEKTQGGEPNPHRFLPNQLDETKHLVVVFNNFARYTDFSQMMGAGGVVDPRGWRVMLEGGATNAGEFWAALFEDHPVMFYQIRGVGPRIAVFVGEPTAENIATWTKLLQEVDGAGRQAMNAADQVDEGEEATEFDVDSCRSLTIWTDPALLQHWHR